MSIIHYGNYHIKINILGEVEILEEARMLEHVRRHQSRQKHYYQLPASGLKQGTKMCHC